MPAKISFSDAQICEMQNLYLHTNFSTKDIGRHFEVSANTVNKCLRTAGIELSASKKISQKMTGKTSPRLGCKNSPETRAKISANHRRLPTTLGKKYSPEERANVSKGLKQAYAIKPHPRSLNPEEVVARKMTRELCKRMVRRILTMARIRKNKSSEKILGYTKEQLREHISKQFKPGMSWENRSSFHIDHIKPVAQFFREGIFDPAVINALENLQVLTPEENFKKGDLYAAAGA